MPPKNTPFTKASHANASTDVLPALQSIGLAITVLRVQRVILDADLAELYGVETKRLNEQVKRNLERFPVDFMFQLDTEELASLRSQFATLKTGRGQHRKYAPFAFTEHGAIMAATVLSSPRAVQVTPPEPHKRPIGFVTPQDKSTPKAKAVSAAKTAPAKAVRKK